MVNPLSGLLGLAAILLYVVFYSMYLKKRTTQNIVWGGIAGCMPVLIAWAAVRNTIEWPAFNSLYSNFPLDSSALLATLYEIRGGL